ncbi:MAG: tetratricopeptide repeat protein [Chloroflexia bacterium]|nr:tetratricopeptide repeat protein [Chloroflexia bacterium]
MSDLGGEHFGHALRRKRLAAGLSQEALSERAGLSVRGISDLERGQRRTPRMETVLMLAEALRLDESARAELIRASRPGLIPPAAEFNSSPADPATANSDSAIQNNLPLQPTPLVGRKREVAEVISMLRRPDTRLVTLTGPGGTGKTRLALQVGLELTDEFSNGVFFVSLAPLTDTALVIPAIAEALGVRESSGSSLQATLIAYLGDMTLLLLLDNFEHVVDASPAVNELLVSCPNLKVIVTSRVSLHLRLEHIFDVAPLGLPEPETTPLAEHFVRYDALALFVDRAQMTKTHFRVSSANISVINAVCQRLDGLPLAIELAAARIRVLSLQELLTLLQHRLPVLTDGARDLPVRHQTLRNTIAWSYDLLIDGDRKLFRQLVVFAGGWTLEAARTTAGNPESHDPAPGVLDRLAVLVDHSLVRRTEQADNTSRFDMLDTIREFGLEQLATNGEGEDVCQRHATYFLSFIEQQGFDLLLTAEADQLQRVDVEYDNVRAAFRWFLDRQDPVMALSLCSALHTFWSVRGYLSEGRRWLDAALALEGDAPASIRVKALNAAGSLACHQNDLDQADRLYEESLTLNRRQADQVGIAKALHGLGLSAQLRDDYERARLLYEECLNLKRLINHPEISLTIGNLAQVVFHLGDMEHAIKLFDECIARDRAAGIRAHLGAHMTDMGLILLERGDDERAAELFEDALRIHHEIGHIRMVATTIEAMAALAGKHGHPEQAARLYGAAQALRENAGYPLEDPDRWHYAHYVNLAQEQVNERTFSAAWAAGQTMSMDEAIGYALTPPSR